MKLFYNLSLEDLTTQKKERYIYALFYAIK